MRHILCYTSEKINDVFLVEHVCYLSRHVCYSSEKFCYLSEKLCLLNDDRSRRVNPKTSERGKKAVMLLGVEQKG